MVKEDEFDKGTERPASNWISWGKIGDRLRGYLLSVREEPDGKGGFQKVYEIEVEAGEFHRVYDKTKVADEPTILNKGEIWQVNGKKIIDMWMRKAEVGSLVVMRYTGDFKAPMGTAKTVEVKLGAKRSD